jgi:hypothetical protein
MGVLHIKPVVLRLLDHPGEVEIERRVVLPVSMMNGRRPCRTSSMTSRSVTMRPARFDIFRGWPPSRN